MPSTEYFGEDDELPSSESKKADAAGDLLVALCEQDRNLLESLDLHGKGSMSSMIRIYSTAARDKNPHFRQAFNNPVNQSNNIHATVFVSDTPPTEDMQSFGKVETRTVTTIDVQRPLLYRAIFSLPKNTRKILKEQIARDLPYEEQSPDPNPAQEKIHRISGDLLANMCRLDKKLEALLAREPKDKRRDIPQLFHLGAQSVSKTVKSALGMEKHIYCDVSATVSFKPEIEPIKESFGTRNIMTDRRVTIDDPLLEYALASLTDAQRTILSNLLGKEMFRMYGREFQRFGTPEDVSNMFDAAMTEMIIRRPDSIRAEIGAIVPSHGSSRLN